MLLHLIKLTDVKSPVIVELESVLPAYVEILKSGVVREPVVVEEETNVALKGHEILEALRLLSAERVPVAKVKLSEVKFKSLKSASKSMTINRVLEAGLKGVKLPRGSFEVVVDGVPEVNLSLSELYASSSVQSSRLNVYNNTLELLYKGWPTPLVKLTSLSTSERSVWAKLEGYNPFSNSVKDRIGWSMIMEAMERGELSDLIYEATSTNTGIALASIGNILGKKAKLFIPEAIQKVSDIFLKILGAEVVRMPVSLTVKAIEQVEREAKMSNATHLNQFENDANFKVHLKHTARELDEQLRSLGLKPTHIIGGLGTSGHMSAVSLYFKSKYGGVKVIGVQPAPEEVIPGIRRIETGMKWIKWVEFDEIIDVKREEAIEGVIHVARREGILIGLSSGAVVHAFMKVAGEEGIYVLIFPDTGYKYAEQFEEFLSRRRV